MVVKSKKREISRNNNKIKESSLTIENIIGKLENKKYLNIRLKISENLKANYLDISNCKEIDEERLSLLCEKHQNIKILNAVNPSQKLTGKFLNKLGPDIQYVFIGLNHLIDPNPALQSLIVGNGKNLLHFGMSVKCFQKTNLNLITENMLKLKSLKLIFGSNGQGTLKNIGKLKELEYLVIVENSSSENNSVISDDSLLPVIKGCNKLKSLVIAGTKKKTCRFTNKFICKIPIYCPQLEQIRFLNGHNINDESLIELSSLKFIKTLHLLYLSNVGDIGLIEFLKKTKYTLKCFLVAKCPNVTQAIFNVLIEMAEHRPNEIINVSIEAKLCLNKYNLPKNLNLDLMKSN